MIKSRVITITALVSSILITLIGLIDIKDNDGFISIVVYCIAILLLLLIETAKGGFRRTWSELAPNYLAGWALIYCAQSMNMAPSYSSQRLRPADNFMNYVVVFVMIVIAVVSYYHIRTNEHGDAFKYVWILSKYVALTCVCALLFKPEEFWDPMEFIAIGGLLLLVEMGDLLNDRLGRYSVLVLEIYVGMIMGTLTLHPAFKENLKCVYQFGTSKSQIAWIALILFISGALMVIEDTFDAEDPGEMDVALHIPVRYLQALGLVLSSIYSIARCLVDHASREQITWFHPWSVYLFTPILVLFFRYMAKEARWDKADKLYYSIAYSATSGVSLFVIGKLLNSYSAGLAVFLLPLLIMMIRGIALKVVKNVPRAMINRSAFGVFAIFMTCAAGIMGLRGELRMSGNIVIRLVMAILLSGICIFTQYYLSMSYKLRTEVYEECNKELQLNGGNAFSMSLMSTQWLIHGSNLATLFLLNIALIKILFSVL